MANVERTYLNELPETALRDPGSDLSSSGTSEVNRWLGLPRYPGADAVEYL